MYGFENVSDGKTFLIMYKITADTYYRQGNEKKAGAVATVLAAVDQARVRKPVHVEGALAEDEMEIKQQAMQQAATKMEVLQIPSDKLSTFTDQAAHVSQVRSLL